jgi:CheY-like chemotaxis protein
MAHGDAKILVIDDEEPVRAYLRMILEREGYTVLDAEDGDAGLERCRAETPRLVITDLVMPRKGGLQTIKELRRDFPEVRIIAISGFGNEENMQLARSFGADRVWTKVDLRLKLLQELPDLL